MSQTPDQLKELGRIFTAVGNGAKWQFASRTRPETWHEPEPGFSPLRAAEIGYLLRVKPWALPPPPDPVPLRKDDIPPNSALRNLRFIPDVEWVSVLKVRSTGVCAADGCFYEFDRLLQNSWEIQRPGEDWKPCSKEPS